MKLSRFAPSSSQPKPELPPKGPVLKRADTLPARLPSDPAPRAEIKPARPPITRAMPDTKPPADFLEAGPGRTDEERIKEAANKKIQVLTDDAQNYGALERKINRDPEAMELIKSRHPDFDRYTQTEKAVAFGELTNHPRWRAEYAQIRNEVSSIPNGATGTRMMRWDEQVFLTNAFEQLNEDIQKNPFHIHGETAIVGDKEGRIVEMNYSPTAESFADLYQGDRYHLHTHPPFSEPFTSSASGADHMIAADHYLLHDNKMDSYVTNGRDVLHISPTGMELTRLIPDPKAEEKLVKFPEAFRVPDPQQPPRPFSNHESPAAFRLPGEKERP